MCCPVSCVTECDTQYPHVGDEVHAQFVFRTGPSSDSQGLSFLDTKARSSGLFVAFYGVTYDPEVFTLRHKNRDAIGVSHDCCAMSCSSQTDAFQVCVQMA
jgi:hypothetical protein